MIAYFSGKAKWAKVRKPDTKYDADGAYTIDLYLSNPELERLYATGLQLEPRNDDDGTFVRFRRRHSQMFGEEKKVFGPPVVINADNEELDTKTLIGNGSEVIVKVEVFDTKRGKGHRLDTIKVTELVPYEAEEESVPEDEDFIPF